MPKSNAYEKSKKEFNEIYKNSPNAVIRSAPYTPPEDEKFMTEQELKYFAFEHKRKFGQTAFEVAQGEYIFERTKDKCLRFRNFQHLIKSVYLNIIDAINRQQTFYYINKADEYKLDTHGLIEMLNKVSGKTWQIVTTPSVTDEKLIEMAEMNSPLGVCFDNIKDRFKCSQDETLSFDLKFVKGAANNLDINDTLYTQDSRVA